MTLECVICISKSYYIVEYECKHTVCISCGVRLLKLYKNTDCPLCKQKSKIFCIKNLRSKIKENIREEDIVYQNEDCRNKCYNLLLHKCKKCHLILKNTYELRSHYRETHAFLLCFECTDNKKQFWFEHELYSVSTLRHHKNGKLNESGFKGHIYCPFCNIYLYDEISAKQHCNQFHLSCTICDILGYKNRYYNNFGDLELHFKNGHYCCTYQYCINIKAYAFPYKTELLEHLLKFHKQSTKLSDIQSYKSCTVPFFDPYYLSSQNNIKSYVLNNPAINFSTNEFASNITKKDLPNFLDRSKILEMKRKQSIRSSIIKRLIVKNQDEVIEIIEKIINKRLSVKDGCSDLKLLMNETILLKLLKELYFEDVQIEMTAYYKILEKQIKFPKFESKSVDTRTNSVRQPEKKVGFKIIELKSTKKK